MLKSIIGLVLSIAVFAILLTGCSDEPEPIPSNGTNSNTTTASSEQGVNPEPTHAPTSAVTNTAAPKTRSAGEFALVSAGDDHTCGVKTDGTVGCWGSSNFGQAYPPNPKVK